MSARKLRVVAFLLALVVAALVVVACSLGPKPDDPNSGSDLPGADTGVSASEDTGKFSGGDSIAADSTSPADSAPVTPGACDAPDGARAETCDATGESDADAADVDGGDAPDAADTADADASVPADGMTADGMTEGGG